ncbi:ribonuclease III [Salinarimonas ramus]|uniref:Ribonuclease 3 n=1 Tax=Salinarimonas ramus TaxID=690164 RepID=A0A917V1Z1_9HYPH|nr:ribonuclease III [Salinarimonas ramus]GGK18593.1 ribonuclease 3 [Salinarimonas ramus]
MGAEKRGKETAGALEARIGYAFADGELLTEALTHMSATKEGRGAHYQRLEFLGDRVLGIVVASLLFETYPDANEGELSKRFSEIVRKETCAEVALGWDVAPHIVFGHGIGRTAARANKSILGDVCEAIIGAVYVDGGHEAARRVVEAGFGDMIRQTRPVPRDPKTVLQEWLQGRGNPPPRYALLDRSGPEHAPLFTVGVEIEGMDTISGEGPSKRAAEQDGARAVLVRLGLWKDADGGA